MARELFDIEPVFAETLTRCAAVVADVLEKPLLDVIFDLDSPDAEETLRQTSYAQPAPASPWRWAWPGSGSRGASNRTSCWVTASASTRPRASRECSASKTARGSMAERGRLFGSLPAGGRDGGGVRRGRAGGEPHRRVPDTVGRRLQRGQHRAVRACGRPGAGSGQADGTTAFGATGWRPATHSTRHCWTRSSTSSRRMRHRFTFKAPQRILIDNRTGAALGRSVKMDGAYWRRHARQPVEFAKSVRTLADLNCKVLLEVGPRPVLTATALAGMARPGHRASGDHLAAAEHRRPPADHRSRRRCLRAGPPARLRRLPAGTRAKLDLPTYPFEHRQYWYPRQS